MTYGHQVLLENGIEDELKPVRVVQKAIASRLGRT